MRQVVKDFMEQYQVDKQSLEELKREKPLLYKDIETTAFSGIDTIYKTPDDQILIIENTIRGNITKISYDVDYDGKMDIFEIFEAGNNQVHRQYDVNRDGVIDIIESDMNNDDVLDASELKINVEGQFIPFTTFNTIVM